MIQSESHSSQLPTEILVEIFSYLSMKELAAVAGVSRSWLAGTHSLASKNLNQLRTRSADSTIPSSMPAFIQALPEHSPARALLQTPAIAEYALAAANALAHFDLYTKQADNIIR